MPSSPERASGLAELSPSNDVGLNLNRNAGLNCSSTFGSSKLQQRGPDKAGDMGCVGKSGHLGPVPV